MCYIRQMSNCLDTFIRLVLLFESLLDLLRVTCLYHASQTTLFYHVVNIALSERAIICSISNAAFSPPYNIFLKWTACYLATQVIQLLLIWYSDIDLANCNVQPVSHTNHRANTQLLTQHNSNDNTTVMWS